VFRRLMTVFYLAIIVSLAYFSFCSAQEAFSTLQYDMIIKSPGIQQVSKFFKKGDKTRVESGEGGKQTVMIFDGKNYYIYYPKQAKAIAMPTISMKQEDCGSLDKPKNYLEQNCKYSKDEVLDGKKCSLYECPQGGNTKFWIDKDTKLQVKTISGKVTIDYKNQKINAPLNDSLFVLPVGVQVEDFSSQIKKMTGKEIDENDYSWQSP